MYCCPFWDLAAGAVSFQDGAYQISGQTCMQCTFNIIGVPVHRTFCTFAKWGAAFLAPKLGTNTLKSHGSHKGPKVHPTPRVAGFFTRCGPNRRKKVLLRRLGHTSAARGPRWRGVGPNWLKFEI